MVFVVCSLERKYNIHINSGNNTLSLMHMDNKDEYDVVDDDDDDGNESYNCTLISAKFIPGELLPDSSQT